MRDPRDEQYARLLVEECIDVQPGWQVLVAPACSGARSIEEVMRVIAERGAYALPRLFSRAGPAPARSGSSKAPGGAARDDGAARRARDARTSTRSSRSSRRRTRATAPTSTRRAAQLQQKARHR